jgi:hypothetical protein
MPSRIHRPRILDADSILSSTSPLNFFFGCFGAVRAFLLSEMISKSLILLSAFVLHCSAFELGLTALSIGRYLQVEYTG